MGLGLDGKRTLTLGFANRTTPLSMAWRRGIPSHGVEFEHIQDLQHIERTAPRGDGCDGHQHPRLAM